LGLQKLIDDKLHLLQRHRPFHESDHVLSLAYSMMCGEKTLDGLSARREDEAFLDALNARRIPHPTTAGAFLRRFVQRSVIDLLQVLNECSARVWRQRPLSERRLAVIDVDGTIAPTTGECRELMSMAYEGTWGYHPLVVSLANSQEVLAIVNRPGNHSSNTNAARWMDHAIRWAVDKASFESVLLRGDTAFALTKNFDRWTEEGVHFVFGIMAHGKLLKHAKALPEDAWTLFDRGERTEAKRRHQANVRKSVVEEKGFKELVLETEHLAEWDYTPFPSPFPI
jgi:hypothetical protein